MKTKQAAIALLGVMSLRLLTALTSGARLKAVNAISKQVLVSAFILGSSVTMSALAFKPSSQLQGSIVVSCCSPRYSSRYFGGVLPTSAIRTKADGVFHEMKAKRSVHEYDDDSDENFAEMYIGKAHNVKQASVQKSDATSRRRFLSQSALGPLLLGAATILETSDVSDLASARGLVQFPCRVGLMNTYHFMRSGESLLEADDVLSTNPLFLTNRENALSERGIEQVEETCRTLKEGNANPTVVKYSLAANSMDTANIVGRELKMGRDRLVPEFTFMDPRALGKWDTLPLETTEAAIWAMDSQEAGALGKGGRPPANEDSTPHETLSDQVIRLRQLLSVLETQYSGDTILIVFPDGTGPALLTAMIGGIPLNRVHELNFRPGEVRLNVTMDRALAALPHMPTAEYTETIERGKRELSLLRENPDEIMSVKDAQYEEEIRLAQEKQAEADRMREEKRRAELDSKKARMEAERRARKDLSDGSAKGIGSDIEMFSSMSKSIILASIGAIGIAGLASVQTKDESIDTINAGTVSAPKADQSSRNGSEGDDANDDVETNGVFISEGSPSQSSSDPSATLARSTLGSFDASMSSPRTPVLESSAGPIEDSRSTAVSEKMETSNLVDTTFDLDEAPLQEVDPEERAKKAMEEYLNRDDGAEAWLGAMSDLMDEDSDEEPFQ